MICVFAYTINDTKIFLIFKILYFFFYVKKIQKIANRFSNENKKLSLILFFSCYTILTDFFMFHAATMRAAQLQRNISTPFPLSFASSFLVPIPRDL